MVVYMFCGFYLDVNYLQLFRNQDIYHLMGPFRAHFDSLPVLIRNSYLTVQKLLDRSNGKQHLSTVV